MAYESETGDPGTAQCNCGHGKEMMLLFDDWYLKLHLGGECVAGWHARSGTSNDNDTKNAFDYSAARQRLKNQGPIPGGEYWIQPNELRMPGFRDLGPFSSGWGTYRITIHHPPTTDTYGRGGFFIHGGKKFGSIGCIDLAGFIDHFVNRLRDLLPTRRIQTYRGAPGAEYPVGAGRQEFSTDCYIPLTVKYATESADMPPWFNK